MFEKVTRMKLRFASDKGSLSVEDLWDLPLQSLNKMAKKYNKEIKDMAEEDFLREDTKADAIVKLKFDVVLYILETKKKEKEDAVNRSKKKEEKARLLNILARKQDEALEGMSEEEILKKLEEL